MGVRVPRITLNADFGDDSAFGELNLLSVGYGMHQAWVFATMFGTASVFGSTRSFQGLYGSSVTLPYLISSCVYICALLFMELTNQKFLKAYVSHSLMCTGSCLSCLGTLLLMAPMSTGFPFFELLSGIMTGIGSSILIIYWGTAFARCDAASIVLNTAVACAISLGLFATVLHYAPFPISAIATAAVPLFELAILWKKTPLAFHKRNEIPLFKPLPINKGHFAMRFCAPTLALGIALGMLRGSSLQNVVMRSDIGTQPILLLAAGCAMVLILITIVAIGGSDRWSRFFQPLIPFIAITMFFIPFAGAENSIMADMFLVVGYLCFESIMWIFFGDLSQRFRLSPIFVFGVGRGTLAFAILLGSLTPVAAANFVHALPFGELTVVLIMLLVIVFAYALLPREREIEAIVAPCPLVKAVSASIDRSSASERAAKARNCGDAANMSESFAKATISSAAADIETSVDANERSADALASSPANDNAAETNANAAEETSANSNTSNAPADATTSAGSASGGEPAPANETYTDVASGATNASDAHTHANVPSGSQTATATDRTPAPTMSSAPAKTDDIPRGGGRFRGKCETVANTFLLSRRETEILFFLAKGHNAAYIQEKLYISEGTAKTHIRHIYRKCDVHNQQDLMRMVEDAQPAE